MYMTKCFAYRLLPAAFAALPLATLAWGQLPLKDPKLDAVVAKVDGKNITRGDLQAMIESAPPDLQQLFRTDVQSAIMQYQIIQFLGQEGAKRSLDERSPLKEQLAVMRNNILAGAMVTNEQNAYPVSNEAQESYYNEHHTDYQQAKMQGIFLSFKPQIAAGGTSAEDLAARAQEALGAARSSRTEADTLTLAQDIVKRARAGEDFEALVEQYSEDLPSKRDHGNLGVLNVASKFPADFRTKVLALNTGDVSDPIRQATGFYIVRVEEKTEQALRDVREEIVQTLRQEHLNQWLLDLNNRFRPQIIDTSIIQGLQPGAQPAAGAR